MEDVACEKSDYNGVLPLVAPNILDHVWPSIPQAVGQLAGPPSAPDEPGDCRTNGTLVADAYLVHVTSLMAKIALVLGRNTGSKPYSCKAQRLRGLFQDKYIALSGLIVGDSQSTYSLDIVFEILSTHRQLDSTTRQLDAGVLMAKFRVAPGFAGTPLILRALTDAENLFLAHRMSLEDQCPSWLYPINMGATTVWKRWDSKIRNGSINPGEMTFFNHYPLGSVVNWLRETVGGLRPLEAGW